MCCNIQQYKKLHDTVRKQKIHFLKQDLINDISLIHKSEKYVDYLVPWKFNVSCYHVTCVYTRANWSREKPRAYPLKSKRKIISGWQRKLTGRRVPIHSNYVPILPVTLALLLQIGPRPSLWPPFSTGRNTYSQNESVHGSSFLNNVLQLSRIFFHVCIYVFMYIQYIYVFLTKKINNDSYSI